MMPRPIASTRPIPAEAVIGVRSRLGGGAGGGEPEVERRSGEGDGDGLDEGDAHGENIRDAVGSGP